MRIMLSSSQSLEGRGGGPAGPGGHALAIDPLDLFELRNRPLHELLCEVYKIVGLVHEGNDVFRTTATCVTSVSGVQFGVAPSVVATPPSPVFSGPGAASSVTATLPLPPSSVPSGKTGIGSASSIVVTPPMAAS